MKRKRVRWIAGIMAIMALSVALFVGVERGFAERERNRERKRQRILAIDRRIVTINRARKAGTLNADELRQVRIEIARIAKEKKELLADMRSSLLARFASQFH